MANKKTEQEKLLEKEEAKRQKRLNKAKNKQYDGGFFGRCLALLIGFILGFVSTIGGIVGGGYYLVSQPTVKQLSSLGGESFDLSKYLSDDYTNVPLKEFFRSFGEIASKVQDGNASISTLAKISPILLDFSEKLTQSVSSLGIDIDVNELNALPFSQYQDFLLDTLYSTPIGPLANVKPDGSILSVLFYGEEGVHFTLATDGSIAEWLNGAHPLTVNDFMSTDATAALLDRISLKSIVDSTGTTVASGSVMKSLLYGQQGIDYEIVKTGETEEIKMLPVAYTYDTDATSGNKVLKDGYGNVIAEGAYQTANVGGQEVIVLLKQTKARSAEPQIEYYLVPAEDGKYYVYDSEEKAAQAIAGDVSDRVMHKSKSISDLMDGLASDNSLEMFNGIELASLLSVTAKSPELFLALAYGTKGTDYEIIDDEIVMIGDAKPKTIGDLLNGDPMAILKEIELGSLLGLTADSENTVLLVLAYGTEGKDYDVVDNKIVMIGDKKPTTIGDLIDGNPMDMLNGMELASLLNLTADSSELFLALAYGTKGTDYEIIDGKIAMIGDAKPKTIGDLIDGDPMDMLKEIELGSLLKVTADSENIVLLVLAYGTKGKDYDVVEGKIVMRDDKKPTTIGDLIDGNPMDMLNGMELASLLKVTAESDNMLLLLAYGEKDVDYRIVDGKIEMIGDAKPKTLGDILNGGIDFGEMTIGEIVNPGDDKLLNALKETKINEIGSKVETLTLGDIIEIDENDTLLKSLENCTLLTVSSEINNLRLEQIVSIDPSNKILYALRESTVSSIGSKINTLTLGDIIDINDDSSQILKSLKGTKINEIGSKINTLKLNEIITIDSNNKILSSLSEYSLSDIGSEAQNLTLGDVIAIDDNSGKLLESLQGEKISELGTAINDLTIGKIVDVEGSKFLKPLEYTTIAELATKIDSLKLTEVFGNDIYETGTTTLKGEWKYLLTDPNGEKAPEDYTISDLASLVGNMSANISRQPVKDLNNDLSLGLDNDFIGMTLLPDVKANAAIEGDAKTIGDLNLTEVSKYIVALANYYTSFAKP